MTIEFKKDANIDEVRGFSGIGTVILRDSSGNLPDLRNYRASNSDILSLSDFAEYGMDFLPTKYKFSSVFPLEYLSEARKESIGGYYSDISRVSSTFFPTLSETDSEEETKIHYFGVMSINDQSLVMISCPPGYDEIYAYNNTLPGYSDSWDLSILLGGEIGKESGIFQKFDSFQYEIYSSKLVWLVISPTGKVKNINLSYRSLVSSNNAFRNFNQFFLRNDDYYKMSIDPEVVQNIRGTNLWFDRNSDTLIGNRSVKKAPIFQKRYAKSNINVGSKYSEKAIYGEGEKLVWIDGKTWISLVSNNPAPTILALSSTWALESSLSSYYSGKISIILNPTDDAGNLSQFQIPYSLSSHDLSFHLSINLGYSLNSLSDFDSGEVYMDYTRNITVEDTNSGDNGSAGAKHFNFWSRRPRRKYIKLVGSDYDGYDITLAPLSGNIAETHYDNDLNIVLDKWTDTEFLRYIWDRFRRLNNILRLVLTPRDYSVRVLYRYPGSNDYLNIDSEFQFKPVKEFTMTGDIIRTEEYELHRLSTSLSLGTASIRYVGKSEFNISAKFEDMYEIDGIDSYYITDKINNYVEEGGETETSARFSNSAYYKGAIERASVKRNKKFSISNNQCTIVDKISKNGDLMYVVNLSYHYVYIIATEYFGIDVLNEKVKVGYNSTGVFVFLAEYGSNVIVHVECTDLSQYTLTLPDSSDVNPPLNLSTGGIVYLIRGSEDGEIKITYSLIALNLLSDIKIKIEIVP